MNHCWSFWNDIASPLESCIILRHFFFREGIRNIITLQGKWLPGSRRSFGSQILTSGKRDRTRESHRTPRGACLHCFRHLFVLKSMQQLEAAGRPVDMNDLLLPTYLGHDHLIDTDQYMRFSGLQVPEAMDAFETFTAGLIPHVEVPYEEE